jgi:hypothetical protein
MLLHIPSGTYVSEIITNVDKYRSWQPYLGKPVKKIVWGFDLPEDAVPIKFESKSKANLWLRQKAPGKRGILFTMIEITE